MTLETEVSTPMADMNLSESDSLKNGTGKIQDLTWFYTLLFFFFNIALILIKIC